MIIEIDLDGKRDGEIEQLKDHLDNDGWSWREVSE